MKSSFSYFNGLKFKLYNINIVVKVFCDSFDDWKKQFDGHGARANVCDESRTTVGKADDKNAIIMMYDIDMQGMQKLMMSEYLQKLSNDLNIENREMHSFEPLPSPQ